jgi:hypothetical protein
MDEKVLLSERSEFQHFPIFCDAQIMLKRSVSTPQGRVYGRLFWITFFCEEKKVIGCLASPDLHTQRMRGSNFYAGTQETEYD